MHADFVCEVTDLNPVLENAGCCRSDILVPVNIELICWIRTNCFQFAVLWFVVCEMCDSFHVLCFSGIRTEQDLYVRLIDSMTKQVRNNNMHTTQHSSSTE